MNLDISVNNFKNICRFCLITGELIPLFSIDFLYIASAMNTQILMDDELPKNICNICVKQLEDFNSYIEKCKATDATLKSVISKEKEKIRLSFEYENHSSLEENDVKSENESNDDGDEDEDDDDIPIQTLIKRERADSLKNTEPGKKPIINSNTRKHECKKCKIVFQKRPLLSKHYRESIKCRPKNYKLLKCELCDREFTTAQRRKEHMNIHTGATPHSCTYCGERFKNYSTYFKHIYKHRLALGEVEKKDAYTEKRVRLKLQCQYCPDKIFASRSGYANHLETKHNGKQGKDTKETAKRFLCNYCAKSFATKIVLDGHIRVHTGERPFECNECGKQFKQKGALKMHQLNHLDHRPRPFQCEICQKTFTQKDHCEVHRRTHTGEKPYTCDFCQKSFNYRTYWKIHLRMHTGETPYSCPVCHIKYHDKCSLRKHQKKKGHNIEKLEALVNS